MKIGISESDLRYVEIEPPDAKMSAHNAVMKLCDEASGNGKEFLVLQKTDGGFLAVPASAVRSVETDG